MSNINSVMLTGRIASDLNVQYTQQGMAHLGFSVGVSEWSKKENKEISSFFAVKAWDNLAQFVAKYGMKGQQVTVFGKLVKNEWTDNKTNTKVSRYEILANNIELGMPPKSAMQGNGQQNVQSNPYAPNGVNPPPQNNQPQPQNINPWDGQGYSPNNPYSPQNWANNPSNPANAMASIGATKVTEQVLFAEDENVPW